MQTKGTIVSVVGHGAMLAWALVSFSRPLEVKPAPSMPVDLISADEFTKLTAGVRQAPKQEAPKPIVEKIAEEKPVEDLSAKVVEKKEVIAATESKSAPEPKPPEPKPTVSPPEPKSEAKAPDKKEPDPKVDPIADTLKKDEAKKPDKKAEVKPPPVQKPKSQQPKFDANQVQALLNKQDPQRLAAAGAALNSPPALGVPKGQKAALSQNEIDALRDRIRQCWSMPGGSETTNVVIEVRMQLNKDGSLGVAPILLNRGSNPVFQATADSALRAIRLCAPYDFLPAAKYDNWKEIDLTFDASWAVRM